METRGGCGWEPQKIEALIKGRLIALQLNGVVRCEVNRSVADRAVVCVFGCLRVRAESVTSATRAIFNHAQHDRRR
jgi:hypothetical protein